MEDPNEELSPPFIEDLFIVDWADETKTRKVVYHVPEAVWKKLPSVLESQVDNRLVAKLLPLLRSEVVIASVPKTDEETGYYLTDLTAVAVNIGP